MLKVEDQKIMHRATTKIIEQEVQIFPQKYHRADCYLVVYVGNGISTKIVLAVMLEGNSARIFRITSA